jgi:hypothetical protein
VPKRTPATSRGRRNGGKRGDARVKAASAGGAAPETSPGTPAPASVAEPGGAATLTEGLDPLDRARASSLADEGGAAGAAVEAQPPPPTGPARRSSGKLWLAAFWVLAGLAVLYLRKSR